MKIGIATPSDFEAIAALYAEAGYRAAVDPADLVIVTRSDRQLAGVVRLCDTRSRRSCCEDFDTGEKLDKLENLCYSGLIN